MRKTETITLEHGSGGRGTYELVRDMLVPPFRNRILAELGDSAVFRLGKERLAFTTDSYVVSPLFFPGGDIGKLAVCGTVNDLAMAGAKPLYLSCSLVVEEGLEKKILQKVIGSMGGWAKKCGVKIVAGDTKVVGKGQADKLYLNTAGVGTVLPGANFSPSRIRPGDRIVVSGTVGDHGMAVLMAREGLDPEGQIKSDCSPLNKLVETIVKYTRGVKFMRDPTRGGVAAALNELVEGRRWGVMLSEPSIPLHPRVGAALEILGLDPLALASEGRLLACVERKDADRLLKIMRKHPGGRRSAIIGEIVSEPAGMVGLQTATGGTRVVEWPRGGEMPRIC